MSVIETDNASRTKTNATRGSVYTIHKYTITNTSNTFQINQHNRQEEQISMRIHIHKLSR